MVENSNTMRGSQIVCAPIPEHENVFDWKLPDGTVLMEDVHAVRKGFAYQIIQVISTGRYFGVMEDCQLFLVDNRKVRAALNKRTEGRDLSNVLMRRVWLPKYQVEAAVSLGEGSFAEGVRRALDQYIERTRDETPHHI